MWRLYFKFHLRSIYCARILALCFCYRFIEFLFCYSGRYPQP